MFRLVSGLLLKRVNTAPCARATRNGCARSGDIALVYISAATFSLYEYIETVILFAIPVSLFAFVSFMAAFPHPEACHLSNIAITFCCWYSIKNVAP